VDVRSNTDAACGLANAIASKVPRTLEDTQQIKANDPNTGQLYTGVCVRYPEIIQCSLASSDIQVFILPS
jgi:hypothetical protein